MNRSTKDDEAIEAITNMRREDVGPMAERRRAGPDGSSVTDRQDVLVFRHVPRSVADFFAIITRYGWQQKVKGR